MGRGRASVALLGVMAIVVTVFLAAGPAGAAEYPPRPDDAEAVHGGDTTEAGPGEQQEEAAAGPRPQGGSGRGPAAMLAALALTALLGLAVVVVARRL